MSTPLLRISLLRLGLLTSVVAGTCIALLYTSQLQGGIFQLPAQLPSTTGSLKATPTLYEELLSAASRQSLDLDRIFAVAMYLLGAAAMLGIYMGFHPPKPELKSSSSSEPSADILERRSEPRRQTRFRTGKVFFYSGELLSNCDVLDRSAHGACVRLSKPCPHVEKLMFVDDAEGILAPARVAWRRGNQIGLKLEITDRVEDDGSLAESTGSRTGEASKPFQS